MSRLRAIWLVARRELLERGRSKGFLAGLVLTEVFVVGSLLLQATLGAGENRIRLGYVGEPPPALAPGLTSAARQFGGSADLISLPSRAAAEAALTADELDGVLVPAEGGSGPGTLVFAEATDDRVVQTVSLALVQLRLLEAGVDLSPPAVESLSPPTDESSGSFLLANVGVIFLFISIFSFGYWVLSGVVEEKQSRVVEVVLATVRPRDLLMGKVFGIGILGLVQLLVLLVTGLIAANVVGQITLPATTLPAVAMLLLWFILGYVLYSTLFGVLGALASRMEEASNVTTPVSFLAMGAYFLSIFVVLNDPDGVVARVASLVPPAAPMVVPMRAALGAIEWWELILSVVVTVLFIYGLFNIGARVYSGAVLQTGGRMKLRDAWRASR
jgi:ABC-2 type transport system permease protein